MLRAHTLPLRAPWLAAALLGCARHAEVARPADSLAARPAHAPAPHAVPEVPAPTGAWRTLIPPPARIVLEHAAALPGAGRVVAAVGAGRAYRLAADRWVPVGLPGDVRARGVVAYGSSLWVIAEGSPRDGGAGTPRVFALGASGAREPGSAAQAALVVAAARSPEPVLAARVAPSFPIAGGAFVAADVPLVFGPAGQLAIWRTDRFAVAHTSAAGGTQMYFEQPLGPGWQAIVGESTPRSPVAALATTPPLIVGRDGEVSAVERGRMNDVAVPVVPVDRPQSLLVVPLAQGAGVLHVTTLAATRVAPDGAVHAVALDDFARDWLRYAGLAERDRAGAVLGVGLADGGAVLFARTVALVVAQDRARVFDLATQTEVHDGPDLAVRTQGRDGRLEVLAAHAGPGALWTAVTTPGTVLVGTLAHYDSIGSTALGEDRSPWPFGVFQAYGGMVHVADAHGPGVCVAGREARDGGAPADLEACGQRLALELRRAHPLDDGILVEDQRIRTVLVDADGVHPIANLPGDPAVYAGRVNGVFALRGREVLRSTYGDWQQVARVPDGCTPQRLAVEPAGRVLIGCDEGVLVAYE